MAAPNLIPNLMTGNTSDAARSTSALGTIPVGNGAGSTNPGPSSLGLNPIMQAPVADALPTEATAPGIPGMTTGTMGVGSPLQPAAGAVPSAISPANAATLDKQLVDTFGKGIGGALDTTITNLGSNDSTYMQAYTAAMAQPNAENLATLNTTLGNAGVSANSSTAAIANADFQTGVTTQEGLQEQQLQQTDEQNLIGLLTGTEGPANKEASSSVWGDIGSVLGAVGSDAATAAGAISKIL